MKKIAKEYINYGLSVLPTKQDKSPNVKGTWKDGIKDLSEFENAYGIGIICGELSGNLECIDFDNHFGDAKENISRFIDEINEIYSKYKFPIEQTVSGGFHFLYRSKKIQGNQKLASKPLLDQKTKRWRPDAIIETRGEGGYFVSTPTKGYKIIRNNILDIPEITVEERNIIISVCKSFNEWYDVRKESFEEKDKPGDIFNQDIESKEEMISCLKRSGWYEIKVGYWRRPSKKDGISATLGKVADNIFYNFSSNAYPFEPEKAYSPFQVITLLDYKGDFSGFAKELSKRYELNKPERKQYGTVTKKTVKKDKSELEKLLKQSYIDLTIPVIKPPVIMKINDFENGNIAVKRLFTLSNFSAITGKSKSKKSYLVTVLLSAATSNHEIFNKISGNFPENKRGVLLFDTEQSYYDAYTASKRVHHLLDSEPDNFGAFGLREFTPRERREIIGFALELYKGNIGYIVIDGIADLSYTINNEEEASEISNLLMKWTKTYNCHITVVIHQNKNDSFATGHLGSFILKKAEAIISVTKDELDAYKSKVKCDMIRGVSDFNDFDIEIDSDGLPKITDLSNLDSTYSKNEIEF